MKQFGQHNNINVTLVDSLSDVETSHVLDVAITHVHAPSGGGYSGAKWMAVDATLRKDGNVVGTAQSKRFSTGGMFSAYKSTCAIVGRCAKTIGQDLAGWLTNPRKGARLGDY